MEIDIRPFISEDFARVSAIYTQGIESNMATFNTSCPSFAEWDRSHLPVCRVVATTAESTVVGFAVLSKNSNMPAYHGVAELSLYVDEQYKNRGIGSKLLAHLCEITEEQGFWTLQSCIMSNNIPSIRLHEKFGFRIVGYRERVARDRYSNWRDTVLMERRNGIE